MAKDKRSLYQKSKDLASSVPVKFGSSLYGGYEIINALKHNQLGIFISVKFPFISISEKNA